MNNNEEDELAAAIVGWLTLLKILFAACCVGLALTVLKTVLLYFGIDIGL